MAANRNGESNGYLKIPWKWLTVAGGLMLATVAVGKVGYSFVQCQTAIEMRCTAVEKKNTEQDETLKDTNKVVGDLKTSVDKLNTHLDWIKKGLDKGRRP